MTFQKLGIILDAADFHSITAAAKRAHTSQPNASNIIRQIEEEVGFPIFERSKEGLMLTKKGVSFVEHARRILLENEKIMNLQHTQEPYRLRLGAANYTPAIEPFLTLCAAHKEDAEADFSYANVSVQEGIQELTKHHLDIVVAPIMRHQLTAISNECKQNDINLYCICTVPSVILVRKDHPAIKDGRLLHITQGSEAMKDYPYVAYRNLSDGPASNGYNDAEFIASSYKIYVDERDVRMQLISTTNAFAFGIRTSDAQMERYQLSSFPVPGFSLGLFALTRPADVPPPELVDYMTLLKEELRPLME